MILPIIRNLTAEAREELAEFIRAEIQAAFSTLSAKPRWMTVAATADYLGVSQAAVRGRIERKQIATKKMGRSVLVDRVALDRELASS